MNRQFSKEVMQMAKKHEKILNIANYWGNASQNHSVFQCKTPKKKNRKQKNCNVIPPSS